MMRLGGTKQYRARQRALSPGATMTTLCLLLLTWGATTWVGCKKGSKPVPKATPIDLRPLAPDGVQGWTARGPGAQFDAETVFEVMNGGAEMYLDYNMKRMLLLEYEQPGRPLITLHLFDMGSSEEAYGVFTSEREGTPVEVGQEADYADGLLRFWRGTYFASLQATRETKAVREALLTLGRHIAKQIPTDGKRPALVDRLPEVGQRPNSLRFVRTWPTLDHHLRLGMGNPLKLSRNTGVALACYGEASPPLWGLVVSYPEAGLAREAALAVNKRTEPPLGVARSCGILVFAAMGGQDANTRRRLLERLQGPECGK